VTTADAGSGSPAPAVTRAAALLGLLADDPSGRLGLSDLARRLDLPKSSISNLCIALDEAGLIRRVDNRYTLGHKLVELASAYLSKVDMVQEFREGVRVLPTASQETVLFAMLDGVEVLYLARHDGTQPIRLASDIGRRMPAVCTALGKAMLSLLPTTEVIARVEALGEFPILTTRGAQNLAELLDDLDRTRARGYAIDDEENTEGVMCFSVPVPAPGSGHPLHAVSVTLLKPRATDRLRDKLVADIHSLVAHMPHRLDLAATT
jgi:IclR family transcriptional regulator, blcABC operon repressor